VSRLLNRIAGSPLRPCKSLPACRSANPSPFPSTPPSLVCFPPTQSHPPRPTPQKSANQPQFNRTRPKPSDSPPTAALQTRVKHKQELQALRAELSKVQLESKSGARVKETAQKEVEGLRKKAGDLEVKLRAATQEKQAALAVSHGGPVGGGGWVCYRGGFVAAALLGCLCLLL